MFGEIDLSPIHQIIIPTYVPLVANLVTTSPGFGSPFPDHPNVVLKTPMVGDLQCVALCLPGRPLAYFWLKLPARIFWGNIGALSVGAAIGCLIVTQGFLIIGFIMLIPHTVNFLMYVYWRLNRQKYPIAKFGSERVTGPSRCQP
jgi:UDP-N-acetylglucosamine--dolichyl-phosphate N-acetylglucosaminephosphotransferase